MDDLQGRLVLITGAASGIGLAMAEAFAAEGCRLVLTDIDEERLRGEAEKIDADLLTFRLDTSNRDEWEPVRSRVADHFGPVDILINNAGIASCGNTLAETPFENFDRMMRINLTGVFNGIRCFVPGMIERRSGHVVVTASLAAIDHPPRVGAYSAAKAGIVALADVLRQEVEEHGIGVTSICPGMVRTRIDETTRAAGSSRPDLRDLLPEATALIASADVIARGTVEAVKANHPYFISHANFRPRFQARMDMIADAFDRAPLR
jgi:NAD(P)-dependent dehydrogenase (short-subunit alcohol dehydrogenase family)